ncbi:MAG: hypothetical protein ABIQ57_11495 [Candidatus Kapaibacterium sp.]
MADQPLDERLLATYEKFYFFALERREKLSARFPILIAIYSILLAGITSSLNSIPDGREWLVVIFYIVLGLQGSALIVSLIYAIRFLLVETYAYVSHAGEIDEYVRAMEEFNRAAAWDSAGALQSADEQRGVGNALIEVLRMQYRDAATNNFAENNVKYGNFSNALKYLIVAAVFALLGAMPYFALKSEARHDIQNVEIVNLQQR